MLGLVFRVCTSSALDSVRLVLIKLAKLVLRPFVTKMTLSADPAAPFSSLAAGPARINLRLPDMQAWEDPLG